METKHLFRSFVNDYERYVFSVAVHVLGDRSEAEDVVQDVFMRLWRNIEGVQETTVKAWLATVTKNLCIDHIRQRRQSEPVEIEEYIADTSKEPMKALIQSRLSAWLKEAIANLKEPYRTLVILRDVDQKSYQEIAEEVLMNVGQVKVGIHRARRQLKQKILGNL